MLVTAFDSKPSNNGGIFLPCEFLFGNYHHLVLNNTVKDEKQLHVSLNPCADVKNLAIKIESELQETLREALLQLGDGVVGLPVDCHLSQVEFDALLKSLYTWRTIHFILGANPDWKLTGRATPLSDAEIEADAARLIALLQTGRKSKDYGFVKFGFIGCVLVRDTIVGLEIACRAASYFGPSGPCIVISYSGCSSEALIDESIQLIATKNMEKRVIVFIPKGRFKEKILATSYKKIMTCSLYDVNDPITNTPRCSWPNEGCCMTFIDLKEEIGRHHSSNQSTENILCNSGIFFKGDHSSAGGLGLRARLDLITEIFKALNLGQCHRDYSIMKFDWKPPFVKEVIHAQFTCDFCKKSFPLKTGDEPYRKFDFVYCSIQCLAAHRKTGWS